MEVTVQFVSKLRMGFFTLLSPAIFEVDVNAFGLSEVQIQKRILALLTEFSGLGNLESDCIQEDRVAKEGDARTGATRLSKGGPYDERIESHGRWC